MLFKNPVLPRRFAHAIPVIYEGIIKGMKKHILKMFFRGRCVFARKKPVGMPMNADNRVVVEASIRLLKITFTYF
jgi:hypothetical protein